MAQGLRRRTLLASSVTTSVTRDVDCSLGELAGTDVCTEIIVRILDAEGRVVPGVFVQGSLSVGGDDDRGAFEIETDTDGTVLWRGFARDEEDTVEIRVRDPRINGNRDLEAAGAFEAGIVGGRSNSFDVPLAEDLLDLDNMAFDCVEPTPQQVEPGDGVELTMTAANNNLVRAEFDVDFQLLDANGDLIEILVEARGLDLAPGESRSFGPFIANPRNEVDNGLVVANPFNFR